VRWRSVWDAGRIFGLPGAGSLPFAQPAEQRPASSIGTVVTYHPAARTIGERILADGGNAADAFIATTIAENVLAEGASSLGGPLGVLVHWSGGAQPVTYLEADFNTPLDPAHTFRHGTRRRGSAALVPGAPAGLAKLAERHGTMKFSDLAEPSIALAEDGFPVNNLMAAFLRWRRKVLASSEYGRRTFFADGRPLRAGETLRQPELAGFLRRLGDNGPDYVYRGAWGTQFLGAVRQAGGHLSEADLENYATHWTPARATPYRNHTIFSASGTSFGGVWVPLALRVWERVNCSARYWSDPDALELMIRTARHVWSEPYLLDAGMLCDEDYISARLSESHASEIAVRVLERQPAHPLGGGGSHSYHIVVRDSSGNIVSGTTTIESPPWGDGLFVEGVPLTTANSIPWNTKPGARRLTLLTAQMAFRDGQPRFAAGTISTSVLEAAFQILVNLIDHEMVPGAAVTAPRFGTFPTGAAWRGSPLLLDRNWLDPRVEAPIVKALRKRGIKVVQSGTVDTGLGAILSVNEPRAEGTTIPLPYLPDPFAAPKR
jgi:gamma-glutamyltranspeptidase/glutathione hydrolase